MQYLIEVQIGDIRAHLGFLELGFNTKSVSCLPNLETVFVIKITGSLWWDKQAGNTYFSVLVTIHNIMTGKKVSIEHPFTYGYDDFYVQRANDYLKEIFSLGDATQNASEYGYKWHKLRCVSNTKSYTLKRNLFKATGKHKDHNAEIQMY